MSCIFASSVIFQQFVPQVNYYAKKSQTQSTNQQKEPKTNPPPIQTRLNTTPLFFCLHIKQKYFFITFL